MNTTPDPRIRTESQRALWRALEGGDRLSIRALARVTDASPATARESLRMLAEAGLPLDYQDDARGPRWWWWRTDVKGSPAAKAPPPARPVAPPAPAPVPPRRPQPVPAKAPPVAKAKPARALPRSGTLARQTFDAVREIDTSVGSWMLQRKLSQQLPGLARAGFLLRRSYQAPKDWPIHGRTPAWVYAATPEQLATEPPIPEPPPAALAPPPQMPRTPKHSRTKKPQPGTSGRALWDMVAAHDTAVHCRMLEQPGGKTAVGTTLSGMFSQGYLVRREFDLGVPWPHPGMAPKWLYAVSEEQLAKDPPIATAPQPVVAQVTTNPEADELAAKLLKVEAERDEARAKELSALGTIRKLGEKHAKLEGEYDRVVGGLREQLAAAHGVVSILADEDGIEAHRLVVDQVAGGGHPHDDGTDWPANLVLRLSYPDGREECRTFWSDEVAAIRVAEAVGLEDPGQCGFETSLLWVRDTWKELKDRRQSGSASQSPAPSADVDDGPTMVALTDALDELYNRTEFHSFKLSAERARELVAYRWPGLEA